MGKVTRQQKNEKQDADRITINEKREYVQSMKFHGKQLHKNLNLKSDYFFGASFFFVPHLYSTRE